MEKLKLYNKYCTTTVQNHNIQTIIINIQCNSKTLVPLGEFFFPTLKVPPSRPNRNSANLRFNGSLLGKISSETVVFKVEAVVDVGAVDEGAKPLLPVELIDKELLVAGSKTEFATPPPTATAEEETIEPAEPVRF